MCRKASQQVKRMVFKIIGSYLTRLNTFTIFHTLILSRFNFFTFGLAYFSEKNQNNLKKIQERASRFVYDDYLSSFETLHENAKFSTLQERDIRTVALETTKF